MEKQPLAATPGMGSIGLERVVNVGNYETYRVGYVKSFSLTEEDPDKVYAEVRAKIDGWAEEIRFRKDNVRKMVSDALPAPTGKLEQVMDALKPYLDRLTVTDSPNVIFIRTRGRLDANTWKEANVIVRAQGGQWRGTRMASRDGKYTGRYRNEGRHLYLCDLSPTFQVLRDTQEALCRV